MWRKSSFVTNYSLPVTLFESRKMSGDFASSKDMSFIALLRLAELAFTHHTCSRFINDAGYLLMA